MDDSEQPNVRRPIQRDWPSDGSVPPPRGGFASSAEFFRWLSSHLRAEGQLSSAEISVCDLLLVGRSYEEIAAARAVTTETIKWQVKCILRKLGLSSTREFLWVVGYRLDVLRHE